MMAYERSKSPRENFGKIIYQFQPETKTLIRKLERILIRLNRQNVSSSFNQTCLNEGLLSNHTYFKIYMYISMYVYMRVYGCKDTNDKVISWGLYKDSCCRSKERINLYFKTRGSTKGFVFFALNYFVLHRCYICVYF